MRNKLINEVAENQKERAQAIHEFKHELSGIITPEAIPNNESRIRAITAQVEKFTQLIDTRLAHRLEEQPSASELIDDSTMISSTEFTVEETKAQAEDRWITTLKTRKTADPVPTIKYFDALLSDQKNSQYTNRFLLQHTTTEVENSETQQKRMNTELHALKDCCIPVQPDQPNLVFIPVVINRGWLPFSRDHIVLITVDRTNQRIEYFDSFGISINDRKETLRQADLLTVKDLVTEVASVFFEDQAFEFRENTELHQKDFHSCHIYVADRARKIIEKGLTDAQLERLTTAEANQEARIRIIDTIFGWIKAAPFTERADLML